MINDKSTITLGEVVTDLGMIHNDPVWKVLSSKEFYGDANQINQVFVITKSGRTIRIKVDEI